jgi:hypothetical protein
MVMHRLLEDLSGKIWVDNALSPVFAISTPFKKEEAGETAFDGLNIKVRPCRVMRCSSFLRTYRRLKLTIEPSMNPCHH